ncbi:MAG: arylsulfatase [Planctomycetota bacterium]|nr:arylsulfatase [Planctomycetota bacterium]
MPEKRPHILLVMTDQQRGDCLGLDGHPVLSTPNLDELGANGAFFRHGYTEVPSCIPARRILMSGQSQVSNGMVGMTNDPSWRPAQTLPGELAKAGYQTFLAGKLHLQPNRRRFGFHESAWSDAPHPIHDGDPDDYERFLQRHGFDQWDRTAMHGVDANGWVGRPSHFDEKLSFSNWCVDEAVNFLRRRDPTCPFFMKVSFHAPHPPLAPPAFYYDRYMNLDLPPAVVGDWVNAESAPRTGLDGAKVDSWRVRIQPDALKRCRAAYYGLINHVDDQFGRLKEALERMRLWNDTFVLFTSDHGEMLGDHHMFRKTYAYEASARVPFLAKAPGWMECQRGLRPEQVVGLQDVLPTLLDAAGAPIPERVDGRSVLPLLRGESAPWREFLHGEHAPCYDKANAMQYLTDGKEKFIWHTQTGIEHFFDLRDDPNECRERSKSAAHRARVELWRGRMIETLKGRPEGFVANGQLVAGRPHTNLMPDYRDGARVKC